MSKLRTTILTALPLAAAGWLWLGHETQHASASAERVRPATLVAPGRVEPVRDPVALAFETTGRIVAIDVDEGVAVHAGQVLARLDDRLAKARLAGAEAAVAQADARYRLAIRGPRREDVDAAKAAADAATADADHRALEQARSERLGAVGAVASAPGDAGHPPPPRARANASAPAAR